MSKQIQDAYIVAATRLPVAKRGGMYKHVRPDDMLAHAIKSVLAQAPGLDPARIGDVIVGCIPEWEDKVLLCRRAIEPKHGLWTLPAGFMENGETTLEGAARETWEEAGARIQVGSLYTLYNLPHINQVYFMFRARLLDLDFQPGIESLETRLFSEAEIPWDEIAFRTVRATLEQYFSDRRTGSFTFHFGDIRSR